MKNYTRMVFALALCCIGMYGQTVSSPFEGVVVDPADAAVVNAPIRLTNTDTKATRQATPDNTRTYRFLQPVSCNSIPALTTLQSKQRVSRILFL